MDTARPVGFWGGTALVVGIIVGSGIFVAPAEVAAVCDRPGLILLLWLAGGIVSLLGGLAYAELGAAFPQSGGTYLYLREGYGGAAAFVFGWTFLLLMNPFGIAAIAVVFAEHLNILLGTAWDVRLVTCVSVLALTALNVLRVGVGVGVAVLLTVLKFAALAAVVVLAFAMEPREAGPPGARPLPAGLVPALAAILWTYEGWVNVSSVGGEIRDCGRTLPRVLIGGIAATIVLYVAVNAAFLRVIPVEELARTPAPAPVALEQLVGGWGQTAAALLIAVSTLGCAHASILTGARIIEAQALFRFLGRRHPRFETPDAALWAQGILTCAVTAFRGNFGELAGGYVFLMWIFYGLTAAAVPILRARRPDLARPYRCPWAPLVVGLFVAAAAGMTGLSIWIEPRATLPPMAILAAGLPVYWVWRRFRTN